MEMQIERVRDQCWIGSVPPRRSGGVNDQHANLLLILNPHGCPTRYREVVLTRCKFDY